MTKNTTYQTAFLCFLSFQAVMVMSQDQLLSFNAGYGIEAFESANTLRLDIYEGPFDDYATSEVPYSSWISHQATFGAEYKFLNFAGAGFNLGYASITSDTFSEGNSNYRTRAGLELTDWRFQPYLKLDVLFNSEHEALNFGAGLNIFHRSHRTSHIAESDTAAQTELKHLLLNRRGWATAYFLELEWEDYFSPPSGTLSLSGGFRATALNPPRWNWKNTGLKGKGWPAKE